MTGRWFRFYDMSLDHPKVQRLPGDLFKVWVNLLCVASKNNGTLPATDDLAFMLRMSEHEVRLALSQLDTAGLIDREESGDLTPHNWNSRQFQSDTSAERTRKYRERHKNKGETPDGDGGGDGRVTSHVTPPDTDTDTDSSVAIATGADAPPDPAVAERELFVRGKEVLGAKAGGLIANLVRAKGNNISLARAAIETASQCQAPAEYIGGVIRSGKSNRGPPQPDPSKSVHAAARALEEWVKANEQSDADQPMLTVVRG